MTTGFFKSVTLVACAVFSTLALAADPPARVGRVSLAEGQVSISSEVGEQASAALVNWPVTSRNQLTTGPGARTEIRIGSTSVRLDGESSMEVEELDDDSLRLHLNYGSANVRVLNADALRGFELSTPNGLIRLQEPGRLRVDAERVGGTTAVNVFDGVAVVEDRGSQLIVRAGKRAEIRDDDVRTGVALRDGFDDWSQQRDRLYDNSTSARYVTSEMTGYEDLDQNGVWRDDAEYGPLWLPRTVGPDWAPYRDGNWTWIAPWGWTWVDNAPWGYAPFHYGRWVYVDQRWAWAPGRHTGRPVWAPALVGWIGGWSASFGAGRGHRPAQGWYPLSPRDPFVPGYRLSHDHLQRINRDARRDGQDGRRGRDGHDGRDWRGDRRHGLTVVPHDNFDKRGTIAVRDALKAAVPPLALQNAPGTAPGAPQGWRDRGGRDRFDRGDRGERDGHQRGRDRRPETAQRPPVAMPAPQVIIGRTQPPLGSSPAAAQPQPGRREGRDFDERRRAGRAGEDGRERQPSGPVASAVAGAAAAAAAAAAAGPRAPVIAPAPQAVIPPAEQGQRARGSRNDGERRMREPDGVPQARPTLPAPVLHQQTAPAPVFHRQSPPAAAPAPAPVFHQQSAPAPVFHQRSAPPPAPAPVAAPAPAPVAAPAPVFHQRAAPPPAPAPVAAPAPVFHQHLAPRPAPAPAAQAPAPPPAPAAPAPRNSGALEHKRGGSDQER